MRFAKYKCIYTAKIIYSVRVETYYRWYHMIKAKHFWLYSDDRRNHNNSI